MGIVRSSLKNRSLSVFATSTYRIVGCSQYIHVSELINTITAFREFSTKVNKALAQRKFQDRLKPLLHRDNSLLHTENFIQAQPTDKGSGWSAGRCQKLRARLHNYEWNGRS